MRIVTTLPSATEIVCLLGLEEQLVGITHECDYPPSVQNKPVVMRSMINTKSMSSNDIDEAVVSTVAKGQPIYRIDEPLLQKLKPDLIITQHLCEVCATPSQVVAKAIKNLTPKPHIISLSPHLLEDVLSDVTAIGEATGTVERARSLVFGLQRRIQNVRKSCCMNQQNGPTVFCMEWLDPVYNSGHWMPELVEYAGGKEVLGKTGQPSSVISWDEVHQANPDVIFATVCGYKIQRTLREISKVTNRTGWSSLAAVKNDQVYVLDGPSYYNRSGPRLVDGLEIMGKLLHPDSFDYEIPEGATYRLPTLLTSPNLLT